MIKRSECKCECHKPGVMMIHCMPCCEPDEVVMTDELIEQITMRMNTMKGGIFYINRQAVIDNKDNQITDLFKLLGFVPVRVELLSMRDDFEYVGYSEKFDDVPFGCMYPTYDIQTTNDVDEHGVSKVTDVQVERHN